ncbi:hypothetical protein DTO164E3_4047 [Paecilomyces variotii]|nr:hypothetical protein DTO164E3_4047 [Paecilomyces variotii]KAJ9208276.1 hypothetical protein DTO032I3_947 [Paecilomyces variotii]KAJ9282271.1 hypothetical protein DTO021D3_1023 [Paecilomyces variotii]KAJ9343670.1 hypothetical protein DTO027B6_3888 [Paecilomyces variotii]KAJ9383141.1 hypothetical protein DTO032I4_5408 [Paecilomyces variotii]
MAKEFKLKDIKSLSDVKDFEKVESEVEGVEGGKILVVKVDGVAHALSPKCTHYGAPLKNGVLTPDGRLTCPWHGACFSIGSGDVEDAPAPNALAKFDVYEKDGAVYIKGDETSIKFGQRDPVLKCQAVGDKRVVIIGGGSGTLGAIQALREVDFKGPITVITKEPNYPIDRTKLSKALIPDSKKLEWRPKEWYDSASVDFVFDEATGVDFDKKTVSTKSGKSVSYSKLLLASGGTPRSLPLPGFKELGNIFLLRFVSDVQKILEAVGQKNKKIVIIGSSFIGMEVGNALAKENEVTIVGMEKAPMERIMGAEVGQIFQKLLEKSGVKFHMNASVERATPSPANPTNVGAVHLKDGTVLHADLVIQGVGVRPATDFLQNNPAINLEKDGSLRVDETFAVQGVSDTFAIGDIATYPYHGPGAPSSGYPIRIEHWNVAQNSGRSAATTIAHQLAGKTPPRPKAFIPIFWSALGQQLRYCGNTQGGFDSLVLKGEPENAKFVAYYCQGDTVVAVASMMMDPIMTKCAELMRRENMPTKKQIEAGVDPLTLDLPSSVKM